MTPKEELLREFQDKFGSEYSVELTFNIGWSKTPHVFEWFYSKLSLFGLQHDNLKRQLSEKDKEIERLNKWNEDKQVEINLEALSVAVSEAEQDFRIDFQNKFDALKVENYNLQYEISRLSELLKVADEVINHPSPSSNNWDALYDKYNALKTVTSTS